MQQERLLTTNDRTELGNNSSVPLTLQCEVKVFDEDGDFDHFEYQTHTFSVASSLSGTFDKTNSFEQLLQTKTRPDGSTYTDIPLSTLQTVFGNDANEAEAKFFLETLVLNQQRTDYIRQQKEQREVNGETMEFSSNAERYAQILTTILEISKLQKTQNVEKFREQFKGVLSKFRFEPFSLTAPDTETELLMNRHESSEFLEQLRLLRREREPQDSEKIVLLLTVMHRQSINKQLAKALRQMVYSESTVLSDLTHQEIVYILSSELELLSRPGIVIEERDAMFRLAQRLHEQGIWFVHIKQSSEHNPEEYHGMIREIRDEQGKVIDAVFDPCPDHTTQTDAELKIDSEHAQQEIQQMVDNEHQHKREQVQGRLDQLHEMRDEILGIPPDYMDHKSLFGEISDQPHEPISAITSTTEPLRLQNSNLFACNLHSPEFNRSVKAPEKALSRILYANIASSLQRHWGKTTNTENGISDPELPTYVYSTTDYSKATDVIFISNAPKIPENTWGQTEPVAIEQETLPKRTIRIVFTRTGLSYPAETPLDTMYSSGGDNTSGGVVVQLQSTGFQPSRELSKSINVRGFPHEQSRNSSKRFPIEEKKQKRSTVTETVSTQQIPAFRIADALIHLDEVLKEQETSVQKTEHTSRRNTFSDVEEQDRVLVNPKTETQEETYQIATSHSRRSVHSAQREAIQSTVKEKTVITKPQELGTNEQRLVINSPIQQVPVPNNPLAKRKNRRTVRSGHMNSSTSVARDSYSLDLLSIQHVFMDELRNARHIAV